MTSSSDVMASSNGSNEQQPDAIVVDLSAAPPGLVRALRRRTSVPVVALSDDQGEAELVAAIDAGADDFLTKPVAKGELLARLQAVLRRSAFRPAMSGAMSSATSSAMSSATSSAMSGAMSGAISTEDFSIDLRARRVTTRQGNVRLTPIQWRLVELLVCNPGRLVSQRQLLADVWGSDRTANTNYLRVFMAAIRRKLEPDPKHPRYFHTEPGLGIRFDPGTVT